MQICFRTCLDSRGIDVTSNGAKKLKEKFNFLHLKIYHVNGVPIIFQTISSRKVQLLYISLEKAMFTEDHISSFLAPIWLPLSLSNYSNNSLPFPAILLVLETSIETWLTFGSSKPITASSARAQRLITATRREETFCPPYNVSIRSSNNRFAMAKRKRADRVSCRQPGLMVGLERSTWTGNRGGVGSEKKQSKEASRGGLQLKMKSSE